MQLKQRVWDPKKNKIFANVKNGKFSWHGHWKYNSKLKRIVNNWTCWLYRASWLIDELNVPLKLSE
jgi:hypothetical protein